MSFILDALKKSETERQQQGGAEFSSVPTSSAKPSPARWLWMLAALLAINIAVLISILMRPGEQPTPNTGPGTAAREAAKEVSAPDATIELSESMTADTSFEDRVARAVAEQPLPVATTDAAEAKTTIRGPDPAPHVTTIDQLRLNGSLSLPEMHLDIHVYSEQPEERFVFINMAKHRERSQLAEGPVVAEITPAGVILEHQGTRFLLPRE